VHHAVTPISINRNHVTLKFSPKWNGEYGVFLSYPLSKHDSAYGRVPTTPKIGITGVKCSDARISGIWKDEVGANVICSFLVPRDAERGRLLELNLTFDPREMQSFLSKMGMGTVYVTHLGDK